MDLESCKSEISENKNIWAERWSRLSSVIGKIFTQRIAYAPFFLMMCLMTVLHKKDVSFCEILVASLGSCLLSNILQAWENSAKKSESE